MNPSWKILLRILSKKTSQLSKGGQYSSPENTENTTKIFLKKSNPAHNYKIHQGWNEGENAKSSQRKRLGYPQRKAHQTHSRSLGRNPTSQKRVGTDNQHPYKKKFSTQTFISSQTKLHKWRKNKILGEQVSTQRFCHHQACFKRAHERGTTHRKEQPVPATPKTYQMVKSIDTMKKLHQLMSKTTS